MDATRTAPADVPAARKHWALVGLLAALSTLGPFSVDLYLPGLPSIRRDFGADASVAQLTMTAFIIGNALGFLFFGPISDRFGRKPPLYVSLALYVVSTVGCALASSIESLIILRFFQAIGCCAGMVISRAIVRDLYHGIEAAKIYSMIMLVFALAPMVAPLIGAYMLQFAAWPALFWTQAVIALAILAMVHGLLRETRPETHIVPLVFSAAARGYASLLVDRSFIGYAFGNAFCVGSLITYIAVSAHLFIDVYGRSTVLYGWIYGLNGGGVLLAALAAPVLHKRLGVAATLRAAFIAQALFAVVLLVCWLVDGGFWAFVIPVFFFLSLIGAISPSTAAMAMESQPHRAGTASALMGTIQFLFGALGNTLATMVAPNSALPLIVVIVGFSVVGLAINILGTPKIQRRQPLPIATASG